MILYKNVDICDLESIAEKGVLSLDASGNDNWEDGHRAQNQTDVVYLFDPIKQNSFPKYGAALLEIDVDEFQQSTIGDADVHVGDYVEYITAKIAPEQIKSVYIPEIFRDQVESRLDGLKIEWCGISASIYKDGDFSNATPDELRKFAQTAKVWDSGNYMYFRGIADNGEVFDLYNVNYEI